MNAIDLAPPAGAIENAGGGADRPDWRAALRRRWPLAVGYLLLAIPTMVTLARLSWSREAGAHGPLVLATGLWLLWRQLPDLRRREALPGPVGRILAGIVIAGALCAYVFGRSYDFLFMEVGALWLISAALLYREFGSAAWRRDWFPLLYLATLIPVPALLMDTLTAPLKTFISMLATGLLDWAGLPVTRQGVVLFVAQYRLLVADACSGVNSLIGLTATSLLYIYLMRRSSWRYALLLVAFIVPVAIVANVVRIVILVLITYYAGDAAAQGYLHETAGLVLFVTALLSIFAIDSLLQRLLARRRIAA